MSASLFSAPPRSCSNCHRSLDAVERSFGKTTCIEWRKCVERQITAWRLSMGGAFYRPFEPIIKGITG